MDTSNDIGFYGKLPCRGDFLQRRVPMPFVEVWDAWLQECMHASKEQLQEAWLDAYLTGPVWRFVLDVGVCGDDSYAGILVPSVDRVGRYFPLTVVARLEASRSPLDVACGASAWFEAAETLVLDALEAEALDIDVFDESVARLRELLATEHSSETSAQSLQRAINVFAYREMSRELKPLTVWWTEGSQTLPASCFTLRGFPEARAFAAMLSDHPTPEG
ncbi:MAG TPA: type VI secretion system-associated protein TagF [Steroidobacter sp.]|uniref:type VI secretion system-associated protein TagF n=1 Tax=Steroidobacter sp. TaxID=1978227 RepID=UPI002EDA526E